MRDEACKVQDANGAGKLKKLRRAVFTMQARTEYSRGRGGTKNFRHIQDEARHVPDASGAGILKMMYSLLARNIHDASRAGIFKMRCAKSRLASGPECSG